MCQLWMLLQRLVEQLDPVCAELPAGKVVDFQDGAQQRAFIQGLMGAFMGAGVEGVDDVDNQGAGTGFDFLQAFGVTTAVGVFLVLQGYFCSGVPARHALEQVISEARV